MKLFSEMVTIDSAKFDIKVLTSRGRVMRPSLNIAFVFKTWNKTQTPAEYLYD